MSVNRGAVDLAEAGDAALASAAALGDRAAFEVLVHRYGPVLYRYARRMLANEHDVGDAVQETFVAAWRQIGNFRGGSSLKTWLFSICARKIVDTYRVKRAQPIDDMALNVIPATDSASDPFVSASSTEFLTALETALAELPPRQRASWVLREIEEMTFPEIGDVLGLTPDTARGHHFRATRTLRERLRRWR
ncbi:sigma-70 family RNA polymerase sigma factor [Mycolicibacterium sp. 050158]|uniref:RNA polymerase sigma factor n=1 Tax=Mycolicibacterium sp. 050158 TaxID=3090602 RepID=UPI00299EC809|nr:sigma-70 family RNA polymerase sigma factor [Mycolicibacterium sp. 050158]MDX1890717.1 sigma-70 family RNA polymerase sigma factor [Mycolicibacterium sp. 050158]